MPNQLLAFLTVFVLITGITSTACAQLFNKIISGPHVTDGKGSRSVNFIDINNDTYPDIFISNGKNGGENNMLYINNQDGTFSEILTDAIVSDSSSSDGASFADADNDGLIDAFVGNWYGQNNLLYYFTDSGSFDFQETLLPSNNPSHSESSSWADIDNDGDLDLFVANSGGNLKNFLYINNGNGFFTKNTTSPVSTDLDVSRCGVWADYDNDHDLDLFVANESASPNRLYENIGNGTFIKINTGAIVTDAAESWGASWGDYDNDGDFDLFVANNNAELNFLYQNNGDKTFTKITTDPIVFDFSNSVGSSWIDYDNDGDLDMFVANGNGPANQTNLLYKNNGNGTFTKITGEPVVTDQGWSYGCGWADFDRDGDPDLMVAKWLGETENNSFYENITGSANNWLSITAVGTKINYSAIGTKIKLKATINGAPVWQTKEISSQHGYCSQNSYELIFGLGDAVMIDSLIIIWDSSSIEIFESLTPNQFLTLYQPGVRVISDRQFGPAPTDILFSTISDLSISSYNWTFGDGNLSSQSSPLHSYQQAGLFPLSLAVESAEGNFTTTRNDYIAVYGDTLFIDDINASAGMTLSIPIQIHNYLPLHKINIPVQWSGDITMTFVAIENTGLRSEFMTLTVSHIDLFNKRLNLFLETDPTTPLPADTGAVVNILFDIDENSPNGSSQINLTDYDSNELSIQSIFGNYLPVTFPGSISLSCCSGIRGNIDNDPSDLINIADLVYLVAYSFNTPPGPAPECFQEADLDASSSLNIADIVYLVDYSFGTPSGPPPLICP